MSHDTHTVLRSMHDLGLATWFGGNLMGAVGLNKAAAAAHDSTERTRLPAIGWAAWWPVQGAAMAAHLVGSVGMLRAGLGDQAREVVTGMLAAAEGVGPTIATAVRDSRDDVAGLHRDLVVEGLQHRYAREHHDDRER